MERKDILEKGLKKAFAYIFSNFCTKAMQQRIEEHPDFSTIQDDPMELLKVIKLVMHDPIRAKYPMASMIDTLWRMINIKQFVNENLIEYAKRFKQTRDVMRSYIGTEFLEYFIVQSSKYKDKSDVAKQRKMKDEAVNKWLAYLLLMEVIN